MRTLHRYILSNFLATFLMAVAVLSFVMTVGLLFGSMKYIARGMAPALVAKFLLQNLPGTLSYSVPVASLVSSLLVFSRLSSDSEISAMRACGVPLSAIMRTPVLLSLTLSAVCFWINGNVSPEAALLRSERRHDFKFTDVTALLEPGTWTQVGEHEIYVSRRDAERLLDLRVNETMSNGKLREIRAASAVVSTNGQGAATLEMADVTIDPVREDRPGILRASTWSLPLAAISGDKSVAASQAQEGPGASGPVRRRTKDLYTWELMRDIAVSRIHPPDGEREARNLSRAKAELAVRTTLALACVCFVLVGIPLGIQSHRRESSAGLAISLAVAGAFYFFCITGESLAKNPAFSAHWIVGAPVVACLALSAVLVARQN